MENCDLNINSGKLECRVCGGDYEMKLPQPLWAISALAKAFAKEHSDCVSFGDVPGQPALMEVAK